MDVVSVVVLALLAALLAVVLKQYKPEYAVVITVITAAIVLIGIISMIVPIISEIRKMMDGAAIDYEYITVLIKAVGICYITQFASDVCKDAGQISISNKIELAGKVALCLSALPLYRDLLSLTQTIIGKAM
ncbi:MAG: stage III sporulation protein AD [Oscillospiraceae bacterium]|nr:stage III sporulation protein AD [Oscillospiraceae bacterium]